MYPVRADQRVARDARSVVQPQFYPVSMLNKPQALASQMNRIGLVAPHRARKHVEQVWPVDREVRKAVPLDRHASEVEELPGLAGVPQADLLAGRLTRQRLQFLANAELVERARAVGADLQPGADFLELCSLLVDLDVAAPAQGRQSGGKPADARACDKDPDSIIP
jgi:hypothetical protein